MPDGIPWRVGNSGPTQFTNIGHKMVTVEQRSVRADGGIGIMDLVLCTEARGMRLVMAVTVSTPTK